METSTAIAKVSEIFKDLERKPPIQYTSRNGDLCVDFHLEPYQNIDLRLLNQATYILTASKVELVTIWDEYNELDCIAVTYTI